MPVSSYMMLNNKNCDLKISVRGHSRSLKMIPFESLGKVSYSHSIATMAASLAVSEIFSITLKSGSGVI